MIKFENTEVVGWEHAIRGMRNPMNSWDKSDSYLNECICDTEAKDITKEYSSCYIIGDNDLDLMKRLRKAGTDHRKYLRMITVYVDITAPLYWWKEFDTYKVGTVANSCSTMHKIHEKEFTLEDFSHEHLDNLYLLKIIIDELNCWRSRYVVYDEDPSIRENIRMTKKDIWWQMIQLLPSSYNQKRTVMMNYEVLNNIYKSRKHHKLDEWSENIEIIDGIEFTNKWLSDNEMYVGFCDWIKTLPYAKELIIGEE